MAGGALTLANPRLRAADKVNRQFAQNFSWIFVYFVY